MVGVGVERGSGWKRTDGIMNKIHRRAQHVWCVEAGR
jgi:hypothetical protein